MARLTKSLGVVAVGQLIAFPAIGIWVAAGVLGAVALTSLTICMREVIK